MAYQAGQVNWNLGQQTEKPKLTKEIIAEKGRMIAKRYEKLMLDLTAAALELANEKDPLGLRMLTEACETALGVAVEACAVNLDAVDE